jgi:hypothetical protein
MAEKKALLIRIPLELFEGLQRLASQDLRSLNGQIEFMLREGIRQRTMGLREGDSSRDEGNRRS